MRTCSVTVAQYERCMLALSVDPCRGWHAPACAPVAECTGRTLHRAMPVGDLHDQAIHP
jgi:hypothetical protein